MEVHHPFEHREQRRAEQLVVSRIPRLHPQVVADPDFAESGVHWSWGNRQKKDGQQFSQELSDKATDPETASSVWDLSKQLVGLP